jgi:excinuclease ABC subunit B
VEYFVSYYDYYQPEAYVPSRDLFIEKDSAINEHIEQMRLSATKSLMERRDVVIVASVSCIYGIGDPGDYHSMVLHLREGERSPTGLVQRLVAMQYDRADMDFKRGTFRVRGDVIDIFPAESAEHALRVEMFDDEIEHLTLFDPLTGHLKQKIVRFTVYPSSHYVTPRATVLRPSRRSRMSCASASSLPEGRQAGRGPAHRAAHPLRPGDAQRAGLLQGHRELLAPHVGRKPGDAPPTLIDYLPKDGLMFIDESHVSIGQVGAMYKGDRSRKENLVEYGFRLPSALDNRPLKFEEFERLLPQTVFVSATPAAYEKEHQGQVVEQVVRPTGLVDPIIVVRPASTQVDDLLGEIKAPRRPGAHPRHGADQAHGRGSDRIPGRERHPGALPALGHRHRGAGRDHPRPAPGRVRRAGGHQPAAGGLDIPEVSLVAILDADKEGFLRSERSLIQTIGRGRHLHGTAILYADRITDSMKAAIGETERRRAKQLAFNAANGITPKSVTKRIKDIIDGVYDAGHAVRPPPRPGRLRGPRREGAGEDHPPAREGNAGARPQPGVRKAAAARDKLFRLRQQAFGADAHDVPAQPTPQAESPNWCLPLYVPPAGCLNCRQEGHP